MLNKPTNDFSPIQTLMMHVQAFTAIMESTRMGVFDTLAAAPCTAAELARKHGFLEAPAEALLEMFRAYGLVEKNGKNYNPTGTASEFLATGSPFFQGQNLALHARFIQQINADFAAQLRGDSGTHEAVDDGWGLEESMTGTVQDALLGTLQDTVAFIQDLGNFPQMRTCCDIGGNHGEFLMALMDLNPDLRGEIADLPNVVPAANARIAQRGYAQRLQAIPCDLRTSNLPELRYDLILASHILYGFVNELGLLLSSIHASLKPGGWFVAQHLNPKSGLPAEYSSVVEFITRISGYKTHHIPEETITTALRQAGFSNFKTAPAGQHQGGLIVAAQKPYAQHV